MSFYLYFRFLFPIVPYSSQAAAVLPARVLEAAGCYSQQSASAGLWGPRRDGQGAGYGPVRGWQCIPQIPRSSWSLLVVRAETSRVIVVCVLPLLTGPQDQLPPQAKLTSTMLFSLLRWFPAGFFFFFWHCDPLKEHEWTKECTILTNVSTN